MPWTWNCLSATDKPTVATSRLWLVARYEYLKAVRRRTFLLMTLGLPVLIVGVMAIAIATTERAGAEGDVGYVDLAGIVSTPSPVAGLLPYPSDDGARSALEAGGIEGYYVIPEDYLVGGKVELFFLSRSPSDRMQQAFADFLSQQLVAGLSPEEQERVLGGPGQVVSQQLGKEAQSEPASVVRFLLPVAVGFLFVFAVMSSAGYLLQAVTDEKENRTIEVMATSLTARQLMVGKSLGLIGIALTQVLVWAVMAVAALVIAGNYFEPLRNLSVPWAFLGVTALFFIPAFVLEGGIMVAIGAAVADLRQGQQISGFLQFLFLLPVFFFALVLTNPDSVLLVLLTLFPPTSFFTIALRWGATAIPWWQVALAWALLVASAVAVLQVAPRVFRRGMLRYGQHMRLSGLLEAARSRG